jgi:hypothetical protein
MRVFICFGLPHYMKYHQNLANSAPHSPNSLGIHCKPLWTFLKMDLTLPLMEDMEKLMKVMDSALETRSSMCLLQPQKHHYHPPDIKKHHMATATPPPAFATTSTKTIDFSIGFGFAALIYISL